MRNLNLREFSDQSPIQGNNGFRWGLYRRICTYERVPHRTIEDTILMIVNPRKERDVTGKKEVQSLQEFDRHAGAISCWITPERQMLPVATSSNDAPSKRAKRDDTLADLARRALIADPGALRELLRKLAPHLRRVVREILGPGNDADDCLQETLVAITNALPTFRGDSTILHYSIRIAIRCAVHARRRSRFNRRRRDRVFQLERALISQETSSGERAFASRKLAVLRELLDQLPAGQAHTFALHAVLDYSPKEISAMTRVPVNTVRSRIRLAREAMRRHIEDNSTLSELFLSQQ
jgi:RNA polymerase sigma-70 factor, ECF subfamily